MAFATFESVDRSTLRWLRTGETPMEFELRSGTSLVARLRWNGPTGSLATAESAVGTWTLKRGGFLNPHVTVRGGAGPTPLARLAVHLSYHRIELAAGPAYRFHRAGVLVPAWKITTDDRREILHIEPVREGRRLSAGAAVAPAGAQTLPELLLLAVLSWYFIVLAWFEDEALVPFEGPEAPGGPAAPATTPRP